MRVCVPARGLEIEPFNKCRASPDRTAGKFYPDPRQQTSSWARLPLRPPPVRGGLHSLIVTPPSMITKAKVVPVGAANDLPRLVFV